MGKESLAYFTAATTESGTAGAAWTATRLRRRATTTLLRGELSIVMAEYNYSGWV